MALILSETGKEVVYKTQRVEKGVKCDICGKFIEANDKPLSKNDSRLYYSVSTGHRDWGNDSWESRKDYDICPECIEKFVGDYLRNCSSTGYIEIDTEHTWPTKHFD